MVRPAGGATITLPGTINWFTIDVDEVLFKSNHSDPAFTKTGSVRMDVVSDFLYIELTNTSTGNTNSKTLAMSWERLGLRYRVARHLGIRLRMISTSALCQQD